MSAARPVRRVFLGLGSNMGDSEKYLRRAVAALPDVVAVSSIYETDPIGGPEQDVFLNIVVQLETALTARQLLEACQAREAEGNRVRIERWGPRTIDVDVLHIDGEEVNEPDLIVPHPRMRDRAFVMIPVGELAPDLLMGWTNPNEGEVRLVKGWGHVAAGSFGGMNAHPPKHDAAAAVSRALAEDLQPLGDLTSALMPPGLMTNAQMVVRGVGALAGRLCADEAFRQVDPDIEITWHADDGDRVGPMQKIADISGPLATVLVAERTALNFMGHLSGIATRVSQFVDVVDGKIGVWDTRKTTPGLRSLEKAAVRAGGGRNHRGNLSDWLMFKDNHLTGMSIGDAVAQARDMWPARTLHVECDRPDQVREAVAAHADAILLDNMSPDEVRECMKIIGEKRPDGRPLVEASGGITIETIGSYADTGVDFVSSGSLTNSAPVLDIGLDIEVV